MTPIAGGEREHQAAGRGVARERRHAEPAGGGRLAVGDLLVGAPRALRSARHAQQGAYRA